MTIPVFRFVRESTGDEVVLEGADIPRPPQQRGATVNKTVTRYAGGEVSVQVHALELEPIELEGDLNDQWFETEGHAKRMRQAMEAMTAAADVVRFEYGDERLWGLFEASFGVVTQEHAEFRVTFEPYWREPPEFLTFFDYVPPPLDNNAAIAAQLDQLAADLDPAGPTLSNMLDDMVDTSALDAVVLHVLSAQSKHSQIATLLDGVVDYVDVGNGIAQQVVSSGRGSARALRRAVKRIRKKSPTTYTKAGSATLRVGRFFDDVERRATVAQRDIVALIRRFLQIYSPVTRRTHVVRTGDTLQSLALRYYSAPEAWARIADANDLETAEITVGQTLFIPREA